MTTNEAPAIAALNTDRSTWWQKALNRGFSTAKKIGDAIDEAKTASGYNSAPVANGATQSIGGYTKADKIDKAKRLLAGMRVDPTVMSDTFANNQVLKTASSTVSAPDWTGTSIESELKKRPYESPIGPSVEDTGLSTDNSDSFSTWKKQMDYVTELRKKQMQPVIDELKKESAKWDANASASGNNAVANAEPKDDWSPQGILTRLINPHANKTMSNQQLLSGGLQGLLGSMQFMYDNSQGKKGKAMRGFSMPVGIRVRPDWLMRSWRLTAGDEGTNQRLSSGQLQNEVNKVRADAPLGAAVANAKMNPMALRIALMESQMNNSVSPRMFDRSSHEKSLRELSPNDFKNFDADQTMKDMVIYADESQKGTPEYYKAAANISAMSNTRAGKEYLASMLPVVQSQIEQKRMKPAGGGGWDFFGKAAGLAKGAKTLLQNGGSTY